MCGQLFEKKETASSLRRSEASVLISSGVKSSLIAHDVPNSPWLDREGRLPASGAGLVLHVGRALQAVAKLSLLANEANPPDDEAKVSEFGAGIPKPESGFLNPLD